MYIDYNMAEIALMICAVSSLSASVGGGFYMFKKEQERKFIAEKKAAPYVTVFDECDYKGVMDEIKENEEVSTSGSAFKSIIIPKGFKVVTYSGVDKGGTKITLGGPSDQKCTSIKSMVVTKV
tara:strand:- start:37 stop:405 length:369 start_codon:yes stop_codon:yes gene_type:complete